MADSEGKLWTLAKALGGIAGAVLTAVLIYYLTRPAPQVQLPQVGLDGFVADVVSQKPIANALVTVDLGPKLATQQTDGEGRYSFIMDGTASATAKASVDVLVSGYVHYVTTVSVGPGSNFAELMVQPEPEPSAPAAAAPVAAPVAGPVAAPPPAVPAHPPASATHPAPVVAHPPGAAPTPVPQLQRPAISLRPPPQYTMRNDSARLAAKPQP